MKFKIWNKQEKLITPTMEVFTPDQIFQKYPASKLDAFEFVILNQNINMGIFMEYENMVKQYKNLGAEINEEMTQEEVLIAIEEFENKAVEQEFTAEERIASALEFQTMMALSKEDI